MRKSSLVILSLASLLYFSKLGITDETGYLGDYGVKDPSVKKAFGGQFESVDEKRSKFSTINIIVSSQIAIPVLSSVDTVRTAPLVPIGSLVITTNTGANQWGLWVSTGDCDTCWRKLSP